MKQKKRVLLLQRFGFVLQRLLGAGMLFVWKIRRLTYRTFTNKHTHTHTVFCSRVIHRQEAESHKNRLTHSTKQRAYSVCAGKMNCLHCIIAMSHQTVINENRMKVLIKGGKKCRHVVSQNKMRLLAGIQSCL